MYRRGQVVVSIRRMEYDAAWIRVTEMQVDDPLFEVRATDTPSLHFYFR